MKLYNKIKDKRTKEEIQEQNNTFGKLFFLFIIAITIAMGIIYLFFWVFGK